MRWVLMITVAILLSLATPSGAQEQLKVGNSYSGNIKLSSSNSGIYLPLPEGTWILTSLEETRGRNANSPMINGRLVSIDLQKRVVGAVSFTAGNDSSGGWLVPDYCNRKDTFFLAAPDKRRGREIRCWGVHPTAMSPSKTAANWVREFYQWVAKNASTMPQTMITVEIYRGSGPKWLHATYFRNPEIDGFPRSATTAWQKDMVVGDPKRLSYLESVKAWGEQWQPTLEAAFAGRPK